MIIHKILNNNVVIVLGKDKQEKIVCGKGIAFQKKTGDSINESIINKVFVLEKDANGHFKEILKDIPLEYITLTSEIVDYAKLVLAKNFTNYLLIALCDHIYNAVERCKEGITTSNILMLDIKQFYEKEYEIGIYGLQLIKEKLKVSLPEDEASFIALHIINAESENGSLEQTQQILEITQEISNIVKYHFLMDYNVDSVYYYRFITHLKFFAQRLITHTHNENGLDTELFEIVKKKYHLSYECIEKISRFLLRRYQYTLSDEEKLYLTIHVERIVFKSTT